MAARAVFTYDEQRYHVGTLKVREVEELETVLGCRYVEMQALTCMTHKLALATMFLRRDRDAVATAAVLDPLSLDEFDAMWSTEEDDLPTAWGEGLPLGGAAPSTPM